VSVLLGPAVNIKRSPLCGRNFEYISEDPWTAPIVQQMMASMQSGMGDMAPADASMNSMMEAMMIEMPLKGLTSFGIMTHEQLQGLIGTLNG